MERKTLYWIRGDENNPDGVREALQIQGIITNLSKDIFASPKIILYGCKGLRVEYTYNDTILSDIISTTATELKPAKKPKFHDGDFLVAKHDKGNAYGIFKSYDEGEYGGWINFYVCKSIGSDVISTNDMMCGEDWRIATKEERQLFLDIMHKCGKDWDADKKQVVDWKWKPKKDGLYWTVTSMGNVDYYYWEGNINDEKTFDLGNCFRTRDEAEAAAERVKQALKGE